ncbi:MAG: hypothetical protein ABI402_05865 [Ferruginibacter sp.]
MKAKLIAALVPVMMLFCSEGSSQIVDQNVLDNYSPEVISRMYQLVKKTNINSIKQNAIAIIFKNQGDAISNMIRNGNTQTEIDSVYNAYQNSWKSVLSSTDQFYYSTELYQENTALRYSYPLILNVIKYQTEIGLSSNAVNYLLARIDSLKIQEENFIAQNPDQLFNSFSLQNKYLNNVMSDSQYMRFVRIYYDKKIALKAKTEWDELVQKNLQGTYDAEITTQQFYDFYMAKQFAYGRYERNELQKRSYLQHLYDTEPEAERKLYYARRFKNAGQNNKPTDFSQFLFAIKNTNQLTLNEDQVKAVFEKADSLEILKERAYQEDSTHPYDAKAFESSRLKNILSSEQYNNFLHLKNSGRAKSHALNDWYELGQRNMTQGHNMDSTVTEIRNFYLVRQNLYDYYADDKITQGLLVAAVNRGMPASLRALVKARKSPGNDTSGEGYNW